MTMLAMSSTKLRMAKMNVFMSVWFLVVSIVPSGESGPQHRAVSEGFLNFAL